MSFRLYDTATREIRDFVPVQPGKVGIYHCGLTVQGPPHIGHIRKEVVFDVLRRWFEYQGLSVTIVANITDIDDKILQKAGDAGRPWWAWAYENERALDAAYEVLGCMPATYQPRATGHVPEMVELMQMLIKNGHAYPAEDGSGDVYFDVHSWPAYGELSGQSLDDMEPAGDSEGRGKRDPRDFALWKGHKPDEPESASWPTPFGRGRPGWHLECSAMAAKYLGHEFDIHGGGIDLRFPHHENELAQSRAAGQRFARFWMHNAWVTMSGEKMSKSLDNSLLVADVVRRIRPIELRYYLLAAHYRSNIDFSEESMAADAAAFRRIEGYVYRAMEVAGATEPALRVPEQFAAAMDNDLAVPQALSVLFDAVREGNSLLTAGDSAGLAENLANVRAMLQVLGLDPFAEPWLGLDSVGSAGERLRHVIDGLVETILDQRQQARARKDFAQADALRDHLNTLGIVVEDGPSGSRWYFADSSRSAD
ncbi:cysteine--tRNA ligase [Actinobacteria bacterium YIM 96077]|uniref:Cysteine--tRNA ligase n=1 Tax=Phytoactinopolyspora halophila TaxID=1981511 RepID=A0A329R0W4_9ACTN|nr:cysteine--tRNA ligase [Phytoactinopolyspora halophila]AYY11504.1 cysteine--tRNA ligase [Actinobacteria bacterium YIM 96077]RAW18013.1 cysteine--tRNA ligase [Phytoactinopolyspora halophila]